MAFLFRVFGVEDDAEVSIDPHYSGDDNQGIEEHVDVDPLHQHPDEHRQNSLCHHPAGHNISRLKVLQTHTEFVVDGEDQGIEGRHTHSEHYSTEVAGELHIAHIDQDN